MFTDKIDISFVIRVNCDRRVGHDCFRPGGRDFHKSARLFHDLIPHIVKISFLRFGDDFLIGERRLRGRVPIDHSYAAIDQLLFVKIDKNFLDGADIIVIERIALTRPIARTPEAFKLFDNDAAVFILPFQDAAKKFLSTEIVARFFFSPAEIFFDSSLRPDAGVVGPRKPEYFVTEHAGATRENVLDRIIEDMPESKHAGNVRRRNDDRERRFR